MIILAEITPYDPAQSAQVTVRFSSGAVTPIYNGLHWPARLAEGFSLGMAIFENGFETPGSTRTAGNLQILIGDGGADALTTYNWDQRRVKIWTGEGSDFANFTLRFDGFVSAVSYNENSLDLTLGDKSNIFDKPLDFPTYLGTGAAEGPAEMTGVVKPFCFGPVFNMEPTLVDATNLIYQVHNRAVQAIDNVFDQAVQLTSDGDAADLSTWTAIPGKYKTDLSKGLFKLGAKPAGLITADVRGDAVGAYVSTAGDILQRLLDFVPDSGSVTVDGVAFAALNVANSAPVSIHGRASLTGRDIFNVLMRSVGGFWLVDWLGNLTVAIHDLAAPAGSVTDRHIAGLSRLDSPAPVWRLKTTYRPTYRVQAAGEYADPVPTAWSAVVDDGQKPQDGATVGDPYGASFNLLGSDAGLAQSPLSHTYYLKKPIADLELAIGDSISFSSLITSADPLASHIRITIMYYTSADVLIRQDNATLLENNFPEKLSKLDNSIIPATCMKLTILVGYTSADGTLLSARNSMLNRGPVALPYVAPYEDGSTVGADWDTNKRWSCFVGQICGDAKLCYVV